MKEKGAIRTFICLELPEDIQTAIDKIVARPLKQTGVKCSWVKPGNIHLTLKFLGDVSQSSLPKIAEALKEVVIGHQANTLSLSQIGTFGGRNPRVVWVGLDGELGPLQELAKSVDKAMGECGFEREKRRFSPHLTIARIRKSKNTDKLLEKIKEIDLPKISFILDTLILMKSELSPSGSIYTPLEEFKLSKG